jgi:dGTPase
VKPTPEVRERLEEFERASLSTWATLACESKGRDQYEDPDRFRTAFQRDRERLLRTDAFTRLSARTYAFVPETVGGGWRTQLSHTNATVELGRSLSRVLRLNEDLVEAIATGQGLGAPPLGPAGQQALGDVLGYPFDPAEQSLRVVEQLETRLNLTWEVRDGILHQDLANPAATPEGVTAALARRVASVLFDLRAAQRAGIVQLDDLPAAVRTVLGTAHEARVSTVLADVLEVSGDRPEIALSAQVEEAIAALEDFMDTNVHGREMARAEFDRAVHCMRSLAIYADVNPSLLGVEGGTVALVDRLASATDREVGDLFTATFRPQRLA